MKRHLLLSLLVVFTLSSVMGCGLKGPLYEKPPKQENSQPKKDSKPN